MEITNEQLAKAFKGTNFGEINNKPASMRYYVAQSVLKRICVYGTGYTMKVILIELGLISEKTLKPSKAALRWMYHELMDNTKVPR